MKLNSNISLLASILIERFNLCEGLCLKSEDITRLIVETITIEPDDETPDSAAAHVCQELILAAEMKNHHFDGIDLTGLDDFITYYIFLHRQMRK